MPLSYQRKIHWGEIHPVTLHPCKRREKLYLTEQRPDIPWIHLPSSGLVRIWSLGRSQQLFFCVFSHFRHGDDQTNEQPGDPSASLLLTSEKAVFCNLLTRPPWPPWLLWTCYDTYPWDTYPGTPSNDFDFKPCLSPFFIHHYLLTLPLFPDCPPDWILSNAYLWYLYWIFNDKKQIWHLERYLVTLLLASILGERISSDGKILTIIFWGHLYICAAHSHFHQSSIDILLCA